MTQEPRLEGYTVEEFIGAGGSADVWRVTAPGGASLAAKVFREAGEASGRAEWRSMRRHAGDHVVPVVDFLRDDDGRSVLLMPYLPGGSLHDVVVGRGGLTAGECVTALAPIAGALSRIHDGGCVHGDVTPRNVLFDDVGRPLLSDLGASRVAALPGEAEWGSAGFVAPEVLEGHAPAASSDVFSLAAVAWFALVGEAPAPASLRPPLSELVPDVPEPLERLVAAGLALTPSARPYSDDVARKLLEAADPVAVPVDRSVPRVAGADAPAESITRRLREEAQKRQLAEGPQTRREAGRGRRHGEGPQRGRSRLVGALALGVTLVAGAALWPTDDAPDSVEAPARGAAAEHSPYAARGTTAEPRATTSTARPSASGKASTASKDSSSATSHPPTRGEVEALLACRAEAWNSVDQRRLERCLAPKSPALTSDSAALRQAQRDGIVYSGVSYRVASYTPKTGAAGTAGATATVTRSGYTVTHGNDRSRRASQSTQVELRLVSDAGQWRISEWSGR